MPIIPIKKQPAARGKDMDHKGKVGELLLAEGLISPEQLTEALAQQEILELPVGETLIYLGYITENELLNFLSQELGVDFINLSENDFQFLDSSLDNLIPREVCLRFRVLPVFFLELEAGKQITLAMSDPLDGEAIAEVERITGCQIVPVLTTSSDIAGGIQRLFQPGTEGLPGAAADNRGPVGNNLVLFVNRLIAQAIQLEATDIHIEPHAREAHIRYRIDGVLHLIQTIALEEMPPIVSRMKIMGSEHRSVMRLDKKNIPHEGSFARIISGHAVDFRVCTFPTIYGEKVALRVLDKNSRVSINSIDDLRMAPEIRRNFIRCIKQPSGIIIATGPTGCGKTTTLHAAINEINDVGLNIVTIEDPVEYHASDFINQSNLLPLVGFTYSRALRSILRQDPDVILVGEVRDLETAEVAVQAAMTGHLVFTTMHTDDAAGAVVRLVDLGIEEFLVSSTVASTLNQRLIRKNCPECSEKYIPSREEMAELRIDPEIIDEILHDLDLYDIRKGRGCSLCRKSGYYGRQGVFEFLSVTPPIKKMVRDKETSDIIAIRARELQQLNMLFEDGLHLVLSGVTSFDELHRIPRGDYALRTVREIFRIAEGNP
jgi:type IV pilus assembly protein PilB